MTRFDGAALGECKAAHQAHGSRLEEKQAVITDPIWSDYARRQAMRQALEARRAETRSRLGRDSDDIAVGKADAPKAHPINNQVSRMGRL